MPQRLDLVEPRHRPRRQQPEDESEPGGRHGEPLRRPLSVVTAHACERDEIDVQHIGPLEGERARVQVE
jgi:hypothetical protein